MDAPDPSPSASPSAAPGPIAAGAGPAPCPAGYNLVADVLAAAQTQPDRIALAILGPARAERWSYGALARAVRGMAGGLQAAGLVPGDRVLLRIGNTVAFPIAFLGAIAAGLVPVPSAAELTVPEVARLARAVAPAAVLAAPGISLPEVPGLPVLGELRALWEGAEAALVPAAAARPAFLVLTSGSSGAPKLVAHAHRAVWARRMMRAGWTGLGPEDRLLHAGAFNWTYTLGVGLLDPWSVGATALIPAPGTEVAALGLLARRHDASLLAGAPGVFRRLLGAGLPTLPRLRHGLSAGEALAPGLRAGWRAATGTDLHEALGMSECSTFLSGSPARPAPEGTLGFPQPGRRLAVLDPEGRDAAPGAVGILAVHRDDPGLMLGYWRADAAPELPLAGDWFLTGDLVSVDPATGAWASHGRRDDLITAGGYRVAPQEIEAAFHGAPGLEDCAALAWAPKPDTRVIALVHAGTAAEAELRALAEAALARYKQPRAYLHLPALPRTRNGKLDRRALAAALRARDPEETGP